MQSLDATGGKLVFTSSPLILHEGAANCQEKNTKLN